MLYTVRAFIEDDRPFVANTWLRAFKQSSAPNVPLWDGGPHAYGSKYYEITSPIINAIIDRATIYMAVNPTDAGHVYGYVVTEYQKGLPILHFAYTKRLFRRFGICGHLLAESLPEMIYGDVTVTTFPTYAYEFLRGRFNLVFLPHFRTLVS